MKFRINSNELDKAQAACLIIGVFADGQFTHPASQFSKVTRNYLSLLFKQGELPQKLSQTLLLFQVPGLTAERILLVGCGDKGQALPARDYRRIITASARAVLNTKANSVNIFLNSLIVQDQKKSWHVKQAVELISELAYEFKEYKTSKPAIQYLQSVTLHIEQGKQAAEFKDALLAGLAVANGVEYTKNLANQPSNVCTPTYLAQKAQSLAKKYAAIKTNILNEADMAKLGMGAFLAVTKGTATAAKLICVEYKGTAKKQAPIALVGKGITFDTGGISLKPADGMIGMKYDMCGAATVLGTIKAAAELKLPIHIVGILAAAENMPSGTACKPEDIVTSMSGQTIEIMNTDAEGRLVLCDALTYCERYNPSVVIDIATLTGAVVIALGHHATGLISNNDPLAAELLKAGQESHDRAWQMPLWEEYQDQLKSPFADMSNVGGRAAGTITAGCFLSRFAKKFQWAHLDVAGTAAMMGGNERYATGRPVPMLTQFLINRSRS
jgi:leucyl aminopeptidase